MGKESSDEKLLKLIEGTSGVPHLTSVGVKHKPRKFGTPFSSIKIKSKLTLYNLNKALFIIGVLLTALFFYGFITGSNRSRSDFLLASVKNLSAFTKTKARDDKGFLSLQEYTDLLDRRNVFLPPGLSGKSAEDDIVIADLVKDLKLVGIIWSSNPEAMIEDAAEKRTYLLKRGEKFSQDRFKIKDITRSSAILGINVSGQYNDYELR